MTAKREIWGPRVWFFLHRLSFFSNRTDIIGAWKTLLRSICETMPCQLCREHMKKYLTDHPLVSKNLNGEQVKQQLILWVHTFHNHVNIENGRPKYDFENLKIQYASGKRDNVMIELRKIIKEIETLWLGVSTRNFNVSARYLVGLLGGGVMP